MLLVLYFALSVINLKFNRIQGTVRTVYTLNSLCVTVMQPIWLDQDCKI